MKRSISGLVFVLLLSLLIGCVTDPVRPEPALQAQLIVKFKPYIAAPSDANYLARLSRDIGAPLTYVRVMAGPAHIYRIGYASQTDLDAAIAKFNRHADVEYAELDRIMRIN